MNILIERKKTITFTNEDIALLEKIIGYAKHRVNIIVHKVSGLFACTSEQEREKIREWQREINSSK